MFNTEQVKSFILHPGPAVSNTALKYFADSFLYEHDTTLMPLVLKKLKQCDPQEVHLFHAYKFPQTEETIRELLDWYHSPSTHYNTRFQVLGILTNCDLQLLSPFMESVQEIPEWKNKVDQKIRLAEMTDQELLDEFNLFLEQSAGKYWDKFDNVYGDELVNELSLRQCLGADTVLEKLRDNDPDSPSYEVHYLIQLAGQMKLEAAIPVLCSFLGADDDLLPSTSVVALVQIGTASVIKTLTEQYISATEEFFRLFAADVLGRIKLPDSEEALLALLPEERDITNATKLADDLCQLGSSQGFPLVEAMIEDGYDDGYLNLTESIYAYCVIADMAHPSLPQWKKKLDAEEARIAKHKKEMDRMFRAKASIGTYNRLNGTDKTYTAPAKVGRNDPCPCGSGKKHKKCCGA
ncbi:SEC-C domain-containing protein [Paenibacillus tritici]|uniref:SEC-C domain-containing protein n=1 Tax=Paenibacillus tritici TaxID=1873425 RepID=A0ABX2DMI7_9BACL|nr:SEC-C metal-binding domain-containing protein [Paenibacillus tritici]NQX45840.1 SEC-C domain-containing protein [Paenibacillus tritici]